MDIDTVVQEKLDNDTEFQDSLVDLSDEDKETAISEKKAEITKGEFEALGKTAKDNETKFKDQQARAKKAEEDAKKNKVEAPATPAEPGLSQADVIYLARTDIHEDDTEEVVNYAQKMGVSIKEAHTFFKPVLAEREEERTTAKATQVKGGNRGSTKTTPQEILEKADAGALPESDDDIAKLAEARRARDLAKSEQ